MVQEIEMNGISAARNVVDVFNEFEGTFKAYWDEEGKLWVSVDDRVLGSFEAHGIQRVGLLFDNELSMVQRFATEITDLVRTIPTGVRYKLDNFQFFVTCDEKYGDVPVRDRTMSYPKSFPTEEEILAKVAWMDANHPQVPFKVVIQIALYEYDLDEREYVPTDQGAYLELYRRLYVTNSNS